MRTTYFAMMIPACALAAPCQANDHPFEGPRAGVEVAYEDYGSGASGEAVAVVAGWDFRLGEKVVAGLDARYTVHGVDGSETTTTPAQLVQTVDLSIEDNWGIGARIGYAVSDNVLIFAQGGYEHLGIDAVRTVRAQACVPPNGCQISRTDFSFDDDMWTVGAGVEWAATENIRLRAQYTYGESDSYDRNRVSLAAAFQF
ncbi:outer membrane beta-barrel protein [Erythrobacter sp. T5W1-R]|uniref:outer membrane protein n=1 Tax=Erythrobacter sp. T5W1-R TaxID=3101752 RepID=UPI002AFFF37E|nr:outer membrane beta-barrel protein [Erythrobacter sp. T5W1-R]MEA1617370.1 outer membrane beta-barrel protein [Erythrobacter sp. T5W1-R]